ncbi:hypothetical protein DL95DRAFT_416592 [Leptodontidium sp. 2 PMI_412]|nr:hypothetical protein DL95DRAFT_416592 [Leptodontidium sp. 2 PMI_412]
MASAGPSVSSSSSTQASTQSLIAIIREKLGSGGLADTITLSNSEARLVLQLLKSIPSTANPPPTTPKQGEEQGEEQDKKLGRLGLTLDEWKAYARLGDYAGKIFNNLKHVVISLGLAQPGDSGTWAEAIRLGDNASTPWLRSLKISFEASAKCLSEKHGLSIEASRLTVDEYAERNHFFHSEAGHLKAARCWASLGSVIAKDLQDLPSFLPPSMIGDAEIYREIIMYYRDRVDEERVEAESTVVVAVDDAKLSLGGLTLDGNDDPNVFGTTAPTVDDLPDFNPFAQGSTPPKHGASEPLDDEPSYKKVKKSTEDLSDQMSEQFDVSFGYFKAAAMECKSVDPQACLKTLATLTEHMCNTIKSQSRNKANKKSKAAAPGV